MGALVGGFAVWYWGEEIREYAESRSVGVRRSAANMIRSVGKKAEDVLDRTKEQVSAASKSGQDADPPASAVISTAEETMPRGRRLTGVGSKERRQYEHIKESAQKSGRYGRRAKEVAARTVMKQHKAKGHAKGR